MSFHALQMHAEEKSATTTMPLGVPRILQKLPQQLEYALYVLVSGEK